VHAFVHLKIVLRNTDWNYILIL